MSRVAKTIGGRNRVRLAVERPTGPATPITLTISRKGLDPCWIVLEPAQAREALRLISEALSTPAAR